MLVFPSIRIFYIELGRGGGFTALIRCAASS